MAQVRTFGMEDVERAMRKKEEGAENAIKKMLDAGALIYEKGYQTEMRRLKLVKTGDMVNSVKSTKVKKKGTARYKEIYPHGTDRNGVRNALKAAVAEYGKSNQPPRKWKSSADIKCSNDAYFEMRRVWEQEQGE